MTKDATTEKHFSEVGFYLNVIDIQLVGKRTTIGDESVVDGG
ncbi:MAG TPA: hypothetical protein VN223_06955 [Candidatus Elarobacter sp.]|nr:hypothetical protein [Candidatus Elarobacter sp.]